MTSTLLIAFLVTAFMVFRRSLLTRALQGEEEWPGNNSSARRVSTKVGENVFINVKLLLLELIKSKKLDVFCLFLYFYPNIN
jgi:hypothetical protein